MENLRIEHRSDGIWLVCDRGPVAKMAAAYVDTQKKDANEIVNLYKMNQRSIENGKCRRLLIQE